jgi:hypothetical protein
MKSHISWMLLFGVLIIGASVAPGYAQSDTETALDNEIKVQEAEIKARQLRILELKLQKLKQQEEEIQNALKALKSTPSDTGQQGVPGRPLLKTDSVSRASGPTADQPVTKA